MRTLGAVIRSFRTAAGLSQAVLAERVGISGSFLSLVESDKREPTLGGLRAIARELGVPAGLLVATALADTGDGADDVAVSGTLSRLIEAARLQLVQARGPGLPPRDE